ncbi:MAG TPA: hypothetical protein PK530_13555, partial [Anaerolineales bacterium]|nr:hypothetical protein [Anaerolineales bacterium]
MNFDAIFIFQYNEVSYCAINLEGHANFCEPVFIKEKMMKRASVFSIYFGRFILLFFVIMGGVISFSPVHTARAATITVNMTTDAVDINPGDGNCDSDSGTAGLQCTLRAAVMEANALAGDDTISVPAGNYSLTIDGYDAVSAVGDLDITSNIIMTGVGSSTTIIQAAFSVSFPDRVIQVSTGVNAQITDLAITGGKATSGGTPSTWGGGILNYGNLTLNRVYVHGNDARARGGGLYFADGTSTVSN